MGLEREARAILIADIVESVRLVELDEEGTIRRWFKIIEEIKDAVIPKHNGRLIKTLGDGILIEFPDARRAVAAASEIHEISESGNTKLESDSHITLRIGIEFDTVIIRDDDILGKGVNRASRLLSLARPGETVISAGVRDGLVQAIDGDIEDLGECHLRHVARPIRAFRIHGKGEKNKLPALDASLKLRPTVAVVPLSSRSLTGAFPRLGDIVSEEIIRILSRSNEIAVISRLSTSALSARGLTVTEIGDHLQADYILSGGYATSNGSLVLDVELADHKKQTIVWMDRVSAPLERFLQDDVSLCDQIVLAVSSAIILNELATSRKSPMPTLRSYTLLLSAVELMHRLSPRDYVKSRKMLEALLERGNRQAVPHAWLANWFVLKVVQGWSQDVAQDSKLALANTNMALDADPECDLALAMNGFVNMHLMRRFDVAERSFDEAIALNPSCATAHLLKGTMFALSDRGEAAVKATETALRLSPLDPHDFLYKAHCAGAHLSAGNFERAAELALMSRRSNRRHASTLRILTVALWEMGQEEQARKIAQELMAVEPELTTSRYLKRSPNADFEIGKRVAHVLQLAGVPR
jgi:class 3 adenylate cyclase/tetratricopeptide (TPR) repeat protein